MIIQGGVVMCACGENAARYMNERGELCCGICPIKQGLDAIKLDDVPQLLGWARITIEYLRGQNAHIPAGGSIQKMLGDRPARPCDDPACDRKCNCHNRGWGGHNVSMCRHLTAALDLPLFCSHCKAPKGDPHNLYCAVAYNMTPELWRTKPDAPHCSVCWDILDRGGNCDRCYRESIS